MSVRVPLLGPFLAPSSALLGRLGGFLGHLGALLGRLGAPWGPLGAILGASWAVMDAVKAREANIVKIYVFP